MGGLENFNKIELELMTSMKALCTRYNLKWDEEFITNGLPLNDDNCIFLYCMDLLEFAVEESSEEENE